MKWNQGRAEIESMVVSGELERIRADRERALAMLDEASAHIRSAAVVVGIDPQGAYVLLYDASRKAMAAVLENQGLRATSRGGHLAVYRSVRAQLDPPMGATLRPFDRMRRRRNAVEYGADSQAPVTCDEVLEDAVKSQAIVEAVRQVLDSMSPF